MFITFVLGSVAAMLGASPEPLTEGSVELVADGFEFTEGPLWLPKKGLIFSDIPADTIYKVDKSVFRKPSGKSNGLTLDPQGRLIACEHWNRRVTREEMDGSITVIADRYDGKRLNSPNDVIVRSDGVVFFTDPPYGLEERSSELPFAGIFAVSNDSTVKLLINDFKRPNGLALSVDERTLYAADTELDHIRAFDVAKDGSLSNNREFCKIQGPDGLKVDTLGRIWSTAEDGIEVFSAEGKILSTIPVPQTPANCAFGDEDYMKLYVTARTAVYKIRCKVPGVKPIQR